MTSLNVNLTHYLLATMFLFVSIGLFLLVFSSDLANCALTHGLISGNHSLSFCLLLTPYSSLFGSVVSFITSVVLIFSLAYMSSTYKYQEFLILLILFVLSILLVIFLDDLFTVMLGWDGLGVISFFLIVYYQSPNTIFSGWFTLIMNRVGDSLLIISIVLIWFSDLFSASFIPHASQIGPYLSLLILIGLLTNSAIFPFSPWLPVAISAPTPISALVHSSTLVTAGLYLIIRLDSFIFTTSAASDLLIVLSVFTSFYAGCGTIYETDLKNLVALSTLSHLGFIGLAISLGSSDLAFFHLLTHALFNSLLFIGVGDYIVVGQHYQDFRQLSSGLALTPVSSIVILASSLSLLGIPFTAGFYSNDYVLEFSTYSSFSAIITLFIYVNVILTFFYTLRIVGYIFSSNTFASPYFLVTAFTWPHFLSLSSLSLASFFFPSVYFYSTPILSLVVPSFWHYLPMCLLCVLSSWFLLTLSPASQTVVSPSLLQTHLSCIFSSMSYMFTLYSHRLGSLSIISFSVLSKSLEYGLLSSVLAIFPLHSVLAAQSHLLANKSVVMTAIVALSFLIAIIMYWIGAMGNFSLEN